jgi:hypothetical protein
MQSKDYKFLAKELNYRYRITKERYFKRDNSILEIENLICQLRTALDLEYDNFDPVKFTNVCFDK